MTEQEKRKSGGGKLTRSETVTVRLDPKLRYLAELAARRQRRTLSSYIEWSIEDSLRSTVLDSNGQVTLADEAAALWDVDDADRFAKLAVRYPDLLTHEEQVKWKLIRENGYVWRGQYAKGTRKWTWDVTERSLIFERLREHWAAFSAAADGSATDVELPDWKKVDTPQSAKTGFDGMDDDIPF
jgi:hypothetical protein